MENPRFGSPLDEIEKFTEAILGFKMTTTQKDLVEAFRKLSENSQDSEEIKITEGGKIKAHPSLGRGRGEYGQFKRRNTKRV